MEARTQDAYANLLKYAVALHASEKTSYEIKETLKEQGLTEELSETITERSHRLYTDLLKKKAYKNMGWGAFWFLGGLFVTIATYSGSGGSHYIVTYGAIISGAIQLGAGLYQWNKIDNL